MNCCVAPLAIDGFAGVTAIDCSAAAVTVSTVEPVTAPSVALIVLVPAATPVASPPAVIVATAVVADAHVTWLVRFCVLLSLNVPVAVNCCVVPWQSTDSPASPRSTAAPPPGGELAPASPRQW